MVRRRQNGRGFGKKLKKFGKAAGRIGLDYAKKNGGNIYRNHVSGAVGKLAKRNKISNALFNMADGAIRNELKQRGMGRKQRGGRRKQRGGRGKKGRSGQRGGGVLGNIVGVVNALAQATGL